MLYTDNILAPGQTQKRVDRVFNQHGAGRMLDTMAPTAPNHPLPGPTTSHTTGTIPSLTTESRVPQPALLQTRRFLNRLHSTIPIRVRSLYRHQRSILRRLYLRRNNHLLRLRGMT